MVSSPLRATIAIAPSVSAGLAINGQRFELAQPRELNGVRRYRFMKQASDAVGQTRIWRGEGKIFLLTSFFIGSLSQVPRRETFGSTRRLSAGALVDRALRFIAKCAAVAVIRASDQKCRLTVPFRNIVTRCVNRTEGQSALLTDSPQFCARSGPVVSLLSQQCFIIQPLVWLAFLGGRVLRIPRASNFRSIVLTIASRSAGFVK
jgi:hypothetical protein